MIIYKKGSPIIRADLDIDERTVLKKAIMGDEYVNVNVTLNVSIDFEIGDYIYADNTKYFLNQVPPTQKIANDQYTYSLRFESPKYELAGVSFSMMDEFEQEQLGETKFWLIGDAEKFVNLVSWNYYRAKGGLIVPSIIAQTDEINLNFSDENCLSVINRFCTELDCEFEYKVDPSQVLSVPIINIRKRIGYDRGLEPISYANGVRRLSWQSLQNQDIATRLIVYGGSKNLPESYGKSRLTIEPLEKNTGEYGIIEKIITYDQVFPKFEGEIETIGVNSFKDSSIDFDLNNYLVPGVSAKVVFNSGDLAGYEFEVSSFDNSTKTVTFIPIKDGTQQMPSVLTQKIGDKYTFVDIFLPDSYVLAAESKLLELGNEYLNTYSNPIYVCDVSIDERYFRINDIKLDLGDIISVIIPEINETKTLRIMEISFPLVDEYKYTLTLTDELFKDRFISLRRGQYDIDRKIQELEKNQRLLKNN